MKIIDNYEVIVCGGGPAGIGAAVMASFCGAKTLLVEQCNFVGGMNGAFVSTWCDTPLGPVAKSLLDDMKAVKGVKIKKNAKRYHGEGRYVFENELLKIAQLKKIKQVACDILLGSVVECAYLEGDEVKGVYVANKNGRTLFKGKIVIDASADGQIAVSAGAKFLLGDAVDGRVQHSNFRFKLEGGPSQINNELKSMFEQARKSGEITIPKACVKPLRDSFPLHKGQLACGWEMDGINCFDSKKVSNTLVDCQITLFELVRFCRNNISACKNMKISSLPALLGTRESRRIIGKYILKKDDVIKARKFTDGIAKGSFWCDFHDLPPGTNLPYSLNYVIKHRPKNGDWYEIPYRCLVPEKTKNILVAGRCISVDRWALASMRIQPTCMFTGSAAGMAAAECIKQKVSPHDIDGSALKENLFKIKI